MKVEARAPRSTYAEAEARLWASHDAMARSRELRLARLGVTVRIQEVGDGPAVLFVHGANTSGASWIALAAHVPGFRRILLDRPGTGLSQALAEPLTPATLPAFADTLLIDVLDALELRSAHLVATSFGGYIALRTAATHPERVERMVQFSWPVGAPTTWVPLSMRILAIPGIHRLMAALPATERSVHSTFRRIGHGPSLDDGRITPEDIACYLALLRETDTLRNELALARAFVSPLRGLRDIVLSDELLGAIEAATLFIWGGRDPFGGEETARGLVERIPGSRLESMSSAGHAPWLDDLEGCARSTAAFLAGGKRDLL